MPRGERGLALIWLLIVVAGLGIGMARLGTLWQTAMQREKEKQLLFVGEEYRRAIASYWRMSPGMARLPPSIDDLLLDPRFPSVVRHLRSRYIDPMTGKPDWGLVKDESGGISGIYSLSEGKPLKEAGFRDEEADFEGAESYRDWVFQFKPPTPEGGPVPIHP